MSDQVKNGILEKRIAALEAQVQEMQITYPKHQIKELIDELVDDIVNTATIQLLGIQAAELRKAKPCLDNSGCDLPEQSHGE